MSSGIFNIGLNNANGSLVLTKSGTMTLDFSQTGPAGYQVPSARTVTAGVGLTGGGSLVSDITIDAEFGTTAGTICQGNDSRLSDARTPTSHTHPASEISDSTAAGRTILTAADAAAQRTALGLGTVATQDANNVTLTGGTLQGVGVVTGSYTSNANEALLRSCRKGTAGTITKGQVVYITGSTGAHLNVELADADLEATSSKTFGVAVENVTSSQEGYVIVEGLLTGLSNLPTASFADGDSLWLSSTAGGWQNTPPANPAHGVYLGRVITASNGSAGKAYIKIQNGYELDELHDVVISSPLDTHSVYYETATQLWKNRAAVDADLSAITVFPRFDADQSATATQKRTARRNIGFSDSFTTAELLALGATESEKLRVAFCSDCFTSGATTTNLIGDICLWDGDRWLTLHDRVQPSTDWLTFSLEIVRRGDGPRMGPFLSVHGDTAQNVGGVSGYTAGTGATVVSFGADAIRLVQITAGPGTTATGSFKAIPVFQVSALTSAPTRKLACVMSWIGRPDSVSNAGVDNWHWRFGLQVPVFASTAALQNDDFGFVMDDINTLGQGASGSNLRALCRANATTLDWVDTGLAVTSASAFLIVTWEPNGPGTRDGRVRVASANDFAATITTHVDRSVTLGAGTSALMPCLNGAKTLGTGTRFVSRRFLQAVTLRTSVGSGGIIS